jgi:hypothetical protein
MPRFVLLYHDCPPRYVRPSHWDLMLEAGDALRTWALARLPRDWKTAHAQTAVFHPECPPIDDEPSVPAEQLADHRLDYLEQEGPLSGSRGHVRCIDRGTYHSETDSRDCWQLTLAGHSCRARIVLRRTSPGAAQWTLHVESAER